MAFSRIPLVQKCLMCAFVLCLSVVAHSQSGPVFVQHPPVTVNCGEPVPALPPCEASSADCPGPVTITTLESETGALENHCTVTPSKLGNSVAWAFWLSLENMPVERWKFDGPAYFEKYADGTAHLWGTIVNYQNSSYKFQVSLWFSNRRGWDEWSALGRGYRNESGLAGSNYINWDYYELMGEFSTFTGIDGLAGDHLDVTPFPTSMYYGFQSGIGANNKNGNAGFGGAFGYSGMVKGEHCGAGVGHLSVDTNCDDGNAGCASTTYTRICKAVDTCGNVAFHTHSVSVVDDVAPVLLPYDAVVEVECGQHYNNFISATDNCSEVIITYQDEMLTPGCNGTISRTYTIADACGNSVTATQTIQLFGDAEPEFTVFPEDTELSCNNLAEMNAADIQWEGPCLVYTLTHTDAQIAGNCPGNYTIIRTYTLTDDCGNQITRDWTVSVYDNEAPVLQGIPASVTINCGDYIEEVNVTAQDNCDASFLMVNMVATTEYLECGYNFIRTWTAVDGCGNVAEGSQTITLIDQQPPVFTYVPADVNLACSNGVEYDENDMAVAQDDCVGVIVLFEDLPLEGNCGTGFTRVFTAIDLCGNTATATQTISFLDTTPPVFEPYPTIITTSCDEDLILLDPVATDECSSVSVSFEDEETDACAGGFVRTFTATDGCGNTSSIQVVVVRVDNTAPVITSFPADITIECSDALAPDAPGLEYYDACSDVTVTSTETITPSDVCANEYTITRIYTLTDACGNSTTAPWIITVVDTTPPLLLGVPQNITLNCGDDLPEYNITATDNCDSEVLITQFDHTMVTDCGYELHRTWVAMDACNNFTSAIQIVTYEDNTAPEFSFLPQDTSIVCDGTFDLSTLPVPEVIDDCGEATLEITYSSETGSCLEPITVNYFATDNCGNLTYHRIFVNIVDTIAPVFTFVPADVNINCDEDFELAMAEATDNCSGATITYNDIFDMTCGGGFQRVFTATDACGNSSTASVTVTIIDTTAPVVAVLPTDITVSCDAIPDYDAYIPEYTEECSSVMFSTSEQYIPSDVCPNNYIIQRKWTITDACGNATTVTWNITVVDDEAPVLVGVPSNLELNCGDPIEEVNVTALDNCSGFVTVSIAATTELNECGYDFIRTWTATDACGNSTQASQTITLIDQEAPVFTFVPEDVTIACGSGTSINDLELATATDDCMNVVVTYEDEFLGSSCGEGIVRTFTATDACGNTATATQMITYADNEAPVFTFVPEDITGVCGEDITLESPVATDDCSDVTIQYEDEVFGTCGILIRTYTAQDGCGNTTTAVVTVNLEDNIAPVIEGVPSTFNLTCGEELTVAPIISDNCTSVENLTIVEEESTEIIECGYILTKTWTVIDGCGNSSTATTLATFTDETAPVFTYVPENITIDCNEEAVLEDAIAEDDCSNLEITTDIVWLDDCAGSFIRTFTATDACGNVITAQQVVTRTDNQGPVFANYLSNVFVDCSQQAPAFEVIATDVCADNITYSNTETMEELECGYQLIRTRTATDGCGNSTTITQVVNVEDYAPPVFSFLPENMTLSCSAAIPAIASPEAHDQCSGETEVTVTETILNGSCPSNYTIYRAYRSSDNCGNEAVHIQTITVADDQGPTFINFEYEIELACEQSNSAFVIVVDNCSDATFTYSDEVFGSACSGGLVRTYVATDGCNNQTTMQQFITIIDDTAPVFTAFPSNVTVNCDEIPLVSDAVVTYQDNCSAVDVQYTESTVLGSCPNNYTLNRTWTLYDNCFNATTRTWSIQVVDNIAPTIVGGPVDSVIDCTDVPPAANVFAIDNCGEEIPVSLVAVTVEEGCNQIFTRRWLAVDACNNASQFVSNVIITDLYAPELSDYPQDYTLPCGSEIPAAPSITALDNCADEVEVNFTEVISGTGSCQIITRTWCATDCVGNEECHTQVITMEAVPGMIANSLNAWSINPTLARVEVTSEYDNNWVLELYDLNGRVVEPFYNGYIGGGEKRIFTFNPRMFEDGIYIVRYTNGKDVLTQKLLIAE